MDVITLSVQFGGVFTAAFLAFLLENVRERRRTARWVREHLGHLRDALAPNVSDEHRVKMADGRTEQIAALDAWLAAEDRTDLTEEQWSHAGRFTYSNLPDLSAVLRSEAVVVVPQDLALALAKLEAIAVELGSATERSEEARRDVLPAWHERRVPLSEGDASRVRHFRSLRAQLHELVPEALEAFSDAVDAIDRWR